MADNRQETIDALLKAGFDPNDLAALMGNIAVETRYTFDHTKQQDNGGGHGLFQFTGTHKDDYLDWIKGNKIPDSKFSQAKFVYDNIYERGVLTNKKTKTFLDSYEKSSVPHLDRRIEEAYKYHDLINQGMFKL